MADRAQLSEAIDQAIRALEELKRVWEAQEESTPAAAPQQPAAQVGAQSKFCKECGATLAAAAAPSAAPAAPSGPAPKAFCMKCGSPLKPGDRFCMKCGTPAG